MDRRSFLAAAGLTTTMHPAGSRDPAPATDEVTGVPLTAAGSPESELAGPARGPWRRLFLDAAVVEQSQGLERVFHSAVRDAANPLIVADKPWEAPSAITGPYVYGTVMREKQRFRLWYQILHQGNHVGYAESADGLHWEKPDLDCVPFGDSTGTNLVVSALAPERSSNVQCHNPSVVHLPHAADPMQRYLLYGYNSADRGPRVGFSPDGIHWSYPQLIRADESSTRETRSSALFASSDVVSFFHDPYEHRICCTWKTRNRRGRAVGAAWSSDGRKWNKVFDGPVFAADDLDPDETQIYGMPVFPYQGMYIGLPWIYRARYFRYGEYSVEKLHEAQSDSPRTIEPGLAWSWDLVNWTRPPERRPFITRGTEAEWDRGMIVTARAPVIVGDELWFYYGGTDKIHDEPRANAAIGLARLRMDGFCSLRTSASDSEGWLITRREPMREPTVTINAKSAPDGWITAELVDRRNRVLPGFSMAECQPFTGDSIHHVLRWKKPAFDERSRQEDCRIRFRLRNAGMFSYLPGGLDPDQPDLARFPLAGP